MSLKRRNILAWVLLLMGAVMLSLGWHLANGNVAHSVPAVTSQRWMPGTMATTAPTEPAVLVSSVVGNTAPTREPDQVQASVQRVETEPTTNRSLSAAPAGSRPLGYALCLMGIVCAVLAVLVLRQKDPLLGPDGVALIAGLGQWLYLLWNPQEQMYTSQITATFVACFGGLLCLRELWGWLWQRFRLSWCLVWRLGAAFRKPQLTLFTYTIWVLVCVGLTVIFVPRIELGAVCFGIGALFAALCLWTYGADLGHFKTQLVNYRSGLPIQVKDGTFAETERQLLQTREQHQQAIQTALTSERFKVELISNVSHDLRTPLTSILGYSELLQKEALSPEGQEQLRCLHQKAGYMNDLVEALFELTKVSSGVVEAKRERIDLIRLLEQTIGLFDDQLTAAGLTVRRSYPSESVPVVTDGSRLHQVFANLLGNAIKYALAGTRIYLEVRQLPDSLFVRLVNTASYEMDFQAEQIVQRFARGDKARTTKGSGLGLAIAQTYTESVGGTFRVCVDADQFSAIVTLPKTERDL